ncbi:hypothetical protein FRC18_005897 [Serendipita sp. 400]|nr:hypothetical protein FRC18_005897 [Serendipita sp. 400]
MESVYSDSGSSRYSLEFNQPPSPQSFGIPPSIISPDITFDELPSIYSFVFPAISTPAPARQSTPVPMAFMPRVLQDHQRTTAEEAPGLSPPPAAHIRTRELCKTPFPHPSRPSVYQHSTSTFGTPTTPHTQSPPAMPPTPQYADHSPPTTPSPQPSSNTLICCQILCILGSDRIAWGPARRSSL